MKTTERTINVWEERVAAEQQEVVQKQMEEAFMVRPNSIQVVWLSSCDINFEEYTEPELLLLYRGAKWYQSAYPDGKKVKQAKAITTLVDGAIMTLENGTDKRDVNYANVMRKEYCEPAKYANEKLNDLAMSRTSYCRYKADGLPVICDIMKRTRRYLRGIEF